MQLSLLRAISVTGVVAGMMLLSQGTARADCGKSAFATFAAKARSVEALPLTVGNLLSSSTSTNEPKRRFAALTLYSDSLDCPDESPTTDHALRRLAFAWASAISLQDSTAMISLTKAGKTTEPRACIPADIASIQSSLSAAWNAVSVSGVQMFGLVASNAETVSEIEKNPHYVHVHKLMLDLAHENNMQLPDPMTDTEPWQISYMNADSTARAHLPDNARCTFENSGSWSAK